jgi:hypothetical protein
MKVKNIALKMYEAILNKDKKAEKELWLKTLKKSLKQKNTHIIK